MKTIMEIKKDELEVVNELLKVNYSEKRVNALIESEAIKVYDIPSIKDMVEFYCAKLDSRSIGEEISLNWNVGVSDFICGLGKEKCPDILTSLESNIVVEILNENCLKESPEVLCYASYIDEECKYVIQSNRNDVLIGYDSPSYYRNCRCFEKELDLTFEEALERISALLNIEDDRLSCVLSQDESYYSVFLDKELVGIWSEQLARDFLKESYDAYNVENHDDEDCPNCEETLCEYANTDNSFEKVLLSDELDLPVFSICVLCEGLKLNIVEWN